MSINSRRAAFAVQAMIVVLGATQGVYSESSCISCHEKEATSEKAAVHLRAGIRCVDCHGGDAAEKEKKASKAPDTGYLGKLTKKKIAEVCGGCHADVRRMNPYGLPTDQLAQYKTSHHGEVLFGDDDEDVATCSDCHGAHGVLAVRDPHSPVHPKNVPGTCGRCHSNKELMQDHDLRSNEEEQYRESVHADLLYNRGDLSAPTCVTCHGNHGAVPPGFANVGLVCGKCHIKQKEFFEMSPHAKPAREGDFETCVTCHGNHKIVPPSDAIFRRCGTCHDREDKDDRAYPTLERLRNIIGLTRKRHADVQQKLEDATRAGFHTEDEQLLFEEAKTYLLQIAPQQHSLDVKKVSETSQQATETAGQVEASIAAKIKAVRWRKLSLIPIGVFPVLMSLGFHAKLRQIRRQVSAPRGAGNAASDGRA